MNALLFKTGQNTEFLPQLQQQSHDSVSSLLGKQTSQGLGTAAVVLPPVRPEHSSSTSQSTEGDLRKFLHRVYIILYRI